jgi:hypothetical protein
MSTDIEIKIQYWPDDIVARIDFVNGDLSMVQAKTEKDLLKKCLFQILKRK